ncbi:hypothetical protein BGP75_25025 [Motiliproteus sp. MSK22-1]|nr:hypothetical protein BGP75_25025 [Motiliproteus sp. MSK22-1]
MGSGYVTGNIQTQANTAAVFVARFIQSEIGCKKTFQFIFRNTGTLVIDSKLQAAFSRVCNNLNLSPLSIEQCVINQIGETAF